MDAELNRPTRAPIDGTAAIDPRSRVRRLATETKAAFKTTEFFAFLALHHLPDYRLHAQPRPGQGRQPRSLRRPQLLLMQRAAGQRAGVHLGGLAPARL